MKKYAFDIICNGLLLFVLFLLIAIASTNLFSLLSFSYTQPACCCCACMSFFLHIRFFLCVDGDVLVLLSRKKTDEIFSMFLALSIACCQLLLLTVVVCTMLCHEHASIFVAIIRPRKLLSLTSSPPPSLATTMQQS